MGLVTLIACILPATSVARKNNSGDVAVNYFCIITYAAVRGKIGHIEAISQTRLPSLDIPPVHKIAAAGGAT